MQIAHPKFRVWNQKHTWKIRGGYFPSQNFCGSRQCSNLSSVYTYLEFLQFNALVSSNYTIRILERGFQFSTLFCVFFAANLTKIQTTVKFAQVPNIKRFAVIFCQYLIYFFLRWKLLWHILCWLVLCSHSFSLCLTCLNCLIHCHCVPIVWVSSLKDSQIYGELGCRLQ